MNFNRTIALLLVMSGAVAMALPCEDELQPVRFIAAKQFKRQSAPVFVDPGHYEHVHGATPIYDQAAATIAQSIAPLFDYFDDEIKLAIARLLLKSHVIQARVTFNNKKFYQEQLWINGHPWNSVAAELRKIETKHGPTAALTRLEEYMGDKSLVPTAVLNPGLQRLKEAAEDGAFINVFDSTDRHFQALATSLKRHLMEQLQTFMDFRTADGVMWGLIRNKMILCQVSLDPQDQSLRIGEITTINREGWQRPLRDLLGELRGWYRQRIHMRNRTALRDLASAPPEESTGSMVSRIYDRPDATPLDRTYWTRFRDDYSDE